MEPLVSGKEKNVSFLYVLCIWLRRVSAPSSAVRQYLLNAFVVQYSAGLMESQEQ